MKFKHKTQVQIRFNDIDMVGHVNNAVYQEFFDRARVDYFYESFGQKINWEKLGLVIASIQIDFYNPVFFEDKIEVLTKTIKIGGKSLVMEQRIVKNKNREPIAKGQAVMVCFDYSAKQTVDIPDSWREKLERYEGETF